MSQAPYGLKPGSVLVDLDPRTYEDGKPARYITVLAVGRGPANSPWFIQYQGEHRKHRISVSRVYPDDGVRRTWGYQIVTL